MIFKDYYKILGFDTNKVSMTEIRNAYREQAKKYHPDINTNDNNSSEEIFKDINEAYRILSNSKSKRKYDFTWNRYVGNRKNKDKNTYKKRTVKQMLADMFFGGITRKKSKKVITPEYGENINTQINVTIEEAFFGVKKTLKFRTVDGKETSFTIKVPAGAQNHDKLRIVGQGKKGKNGGKNGDLLVNINIVNDKRLKLVGNDIQLELPIKVWEAALGTTQKIKVLNEELQIIIPKCTSSGDTLTIKGKGYRNVRGDRGNLQIITKIILPKEIGSKENKIFEKLKLVEV